MSERTLSDYGRAAVALPGFRWMPGMLDGGWGQRILATNSAGTILSVFPSRRRMAEPVERWPNVDDPATAGAIEPLLGADLVTWDSREDTRGIEVTWADGDHVYIHCETKGRGLVLAAEYRGRWDGGVR